MKWIEVIELRTAAQNKDALDLYLKSLIEDVNRNSNQLVLNVFKHVAIDCDYMIQLTHPSQQTEMNGSDFGLRLVDALKDFGLVNHTVWTENLCD